MLDSEMVTRYYTYNAYNWFFYDDNLVAEGVLAGLNPSDVPTVYSDPFLGMNTIPTLLHWVETAKTNDTVAMKYI